MGEMMQELQWHAARSQILTAGPAKLFSGEKCRICGLSEDRFVAYTAARLALVDLSETSERWTRRLSIDFTVQRLFATSTNKLLIVSGDNQVFAYDVTKEKCKLLSKKTANPLSFVQGSNGTIAWASDKGSIYVFDGNHKVCIARTSKKISCLLVCSNGDIIAGSNSGRLFFWNKSEGHLWEKKLNKKFANKQVDRIMELATGKIAVATSGNVLVIGLDRAAINEVAPFSCTALVPAGRSFDQSCLVVQQLLLKQSQTPGVAQICHLDDQTQVDSLPMKNLAFASLIGTFIIYGKEGDVLQVFDRAGGEMSTEVADLQASQRICSFPDGKLLCPGGGKALGILDPMTKSVQMFELPKGQYPFTEFTLLGSERIVVATDDGSVFYGNASQTPE